MKTCLSALFELQTKTYYYREVMNDCKWSIVLQIAYHWGNWPFGCFPPREWGSEGNGEGNGRKVEEGQGWKYQNGSSRSFRKIPRVINVNCYISKTRLELCFFEITNIFIYSQLLLSQC